MGEHAALTALRVADRPRGAGRARAPPRTSTSPRRTTRGLPRRPGHAVPRASSATRTCAPTPRVEKLAQAQAGLRQGRGGHDDRRQLDAADRRRVGRAARLGGVGGASARLPVLAYLVDVRDRGGRLRARRRGPADGAGVRRAADAGARGPDARRTSTSTRSTRRSPRRCSPRSRRGRTRSSARSGSASTRRSARSTGRSSTSTARRWPPATRSPRPAAGSSATLAKLLAEKGSGRGLISICAAGGQGVIAILER